MNEEHLHITKDTRRGHEHFLNEICYHISPAGLNDLIKNELESFNLIDVRKYEKYIDGHIPYATHIPHFQLEENFNKVSKDKITVVYSSDAYCLLAKRCAAKLTEHGYPTMELVGGFKAWKKKDYDIIKESAPNDSL